MYSHIKRRIIMSKRAEERALEAYPNESFVSEEYADMCRSFFIEGYEQAKKDLGWHSVDDSLPEVDEEVIVLTDIITKGGLNAGFGRIAFGHIVDKDIAVDYNGWNIEGVRYWMPYPELPGK